MQHEYTTAGPQEARIRHGVLVRYNFMHVLTIGEALKLAARAIR